MSQTPEAGLELETKFFVLAFMLFFFKPKVEINGSAPMSLEWGVNHIPLSAGQHNVVVYFPYIFMKQCGKAQITVNVPAGQVAQVRYKAPTWFILMAGKIAQTGQRPMMAAGAAPMPAPAPIQAAPPAAAMPTMAPAPEPAPVVAPAPEPAPVAAATAADWYPDPTGRHQHRYWNGTAWTADVADAGVSGTDPV